MYSTFSGDFTGEINLYTVQYPGHGDGREIKSSVEEVGALLANELKEADKRDSFVYHGIFLQLLYCL